MVKGKNHFQERVERREIIKKKLEILIFRDPFLLPSDSRGKKTAEIMKKRLAGNTFSDHYALLNAFKVIV